MYKKLLSYVREFKAYAIVTPIFMVLEVVFETLIPIYLGKIVDEGISNGDMASVYKNGGIMIILAVLGLLTGLGGGIYSAKASTGFARNIRKAMYDNIQRYSFSNIDKFSTAGLVTRMTTDVTNVQNAFQMILRMCIRAPFSMIISMIAAFLISPRIARIYLYAILFLSVLIVIIVKSAMKHFRAVFEKYDALNSSVQENTNAIRVVKAFVREDYEKEKFKLANNNIYKMFIKAESRVIVNAPIMNGTIYTCILLISWIGAHMIVDGTLTTGNLTSLLAYCLSILFSLLMMSMIFVMVSMSMASAERIMAVIDEEPDIVNCDKPVMEVKDGSISFEDVEFSYRSGSGEPVLKDINFSVKPGETIGILGGTGSAKSSLVNLISRLYDVNKGSVKVGGVDVRDYDIETLRNEVSVVLQKNVLFSGTILDNLRWGNKEATREECIKACELAQASEFIEKMPDGYDTYIEQGGTNVSGGQKQRLCIARALLKKPKVLILDDSTSAVDTATDAKIRRAFEEEIPNTTKIIIAQRISSIYDPSSIQQSNRIMVLDEGRIVGFGTHDELLKENKIYREVYESQVGGGGDFDERRDS